MLLKSLLSLTHHAGLGLLRSAALALVFLFLASPVSALTIDTTPSWDGSQAIGSFGETNTATYGQTIVADAAENYLNSFTFFLNDSLNSDVVDFEAYVYAWDGVKATGSALFQSGPMSTTNNGGADGFEAFTINTGGVELVGGNSYVMFFSASNLFDGVRGTSIWGYTDQTYADGDFVFMNNTADFSLLTVNNWSVRTINDLAFVAEFGDSAPVPEPGTALLMGLGLSVLGARKQRR